MIGDSLEDLIVRDYKPPCTYLGQPRPDKQHGRFSKLIELATDYALRPVIHVDLCEGCMKCVRACPVKTISVADEKPRIDYSKCIKCYCCHEMCDSHAISLERNDAAGKALNRLARRK